MLFYERRMEEADIIILLLFNRFSCLYRAYCRYIRYKNTTRPDMAEGCKEKFDQNSLNGYYGMEEGKRKRSDIKVWSRNTEIKQL